MKTFSTFKCGKMNLRNRIVMAPMCTHFNITSKKAINYYSKRAKGGAALIIVESTSSELFKNGNFCSDLTSLSSAIHKYDSKVIIQLSVTPQIDSDNNKSSLNFINKLTIDEIEYYVKELGKAAEKCYTAGFDGIEIHGAHGYFISSFFNPYKNKRTDTYGGSFDKRMNFALDCVKSVRSVVADNFVISYRLSADEIIPEGIKINETIKICQNLEKAGADIIHVSAGVADTADELVTPAKNSPFGIFSDYAEEIKNNISIPVITVGKNHNLKTCENILQNNKADLIAVGRPLIADSNWINKIKENKTDEIRECIYCNKCIREISKGNPLKCSVNKNLF